MQVIQEGVRMRYWEYAAKYRKFVRSGGDLGTGQKLIFLLMSKEIDRRILHRNKMLKRSLTTQEICEEFDIQNQIWKDVCDQTDIPKDKFMEFLKEKSPISFNILCKAGLKVPESLAESKGDQNA